MRTIEHAEAQAKQILPSRACSRAGLTLVELILAMAITSMACVAIAATMKATTNTWEANQQDDQTLVSARIAIARLRNVISQAKIVYRKSADALLIWAGDYNGNFQMEYSECVAIEYDSLTRQLQFLDIYFPPGTPQGDIDSRNVALTSAEFTSPQFVSTFMADAYMRARTIVDNVIIFSVHVTGQDPYVRTAMFSFRLGQDDLSQQFDAVASMRSPAYYLVE